MTNLKTPELNYLKAYQLKLYGRSLTIAINKISNKLKQNNLQLIFYLKILIRINLNQKLINILKQFKIHTNNTKLPYQMLTHLNLKNKILWISLVSFLEKLYSHLAILILFNLLLSTHLTIDSITKESIKAHSQ